MGNKEKKKEYKSRESLILSKMDELYTRINQSFDLDTRDLEQEISYLESELVKIREQLYIWGWYGKDKYRKFRKKFEWCFLWEKE